MHDGESPPPPAAPQVLSAVIPPGANAGFIICREQFLRHFVTPSVALMFDIGDDANTPLDQRMADFLNSFKLANDNKLITNTTAIKTYAMQTGDNPDDASTIRQLDLKPGNFTLELDGSLLKLDFQDLHFQVSPGIDVFMQFHSEAQLGLQDGEIRLTLNEQLRSFHSTVVKDPELAENAILIDIAVTVAACALGSAIGGAIGARVAGGAVKAAAEDAASLTTETISSTAASAESVLGPDGVQAATQTAARDSSEETMNNLRRVFGAKPKPMRGFFGRNWPRILGGMLGAGIGATLGSMPDILALAGQNQASSELPRLDHLSLAAVQAVQWPRATAFTPTSAQLADCLQFGGNLNFTAAGHSGAEGL